MGCRYCMVACPFGVPKYEWNKLLPRVQKCTMCADRVEAGEQTACAEICPTGATKFGERDDLILEAQQRIRDNPGKYVNHIYGLNEVGGTSVLLLSSVPFEEFGYRTDLSRDPLPMFTYRVLSRIPDFIPLGGMVLGGVWWITHRREEVAAAEGGTEKTVCIRAATTEDAMKIKLTFWKLIFFFIMASAVYATVCAIHQGAGAVDEFERPVPLGDLDRV